MIGRSSDKTHKVCLKIDQPGRDLRCKKTNWSFHFGCDRSRRCLPLRIEHCSFMWRNRQSYRRRAGPQHLWPERLRRSGRGCERWCPTARVGLSFPHAKRAFLLSERRRPLEQTQRTTCPRPARAVLHNLARDSPIKMYA